MPYIGRTMTPNADWQPLRVLIVEDCADTADSLAILLRLWGHEPAIAYRADSALALASRQGFDVVVLDVGLPDVSSGVELARKLRVLPGVGGALIVVNSGFGRPADRARCYAAGCDAFLVKPADPEAIRQLLAARQRERRGHDG